ncbi:shikimate dehydrogenase family protein [Flagellimonas myxillae]|uniref:shikimate dehydrogenase family protein n=1 Tax=Flagellimonas myxillae TaxID=2942214 RepID=UPI00201EF860|nr:shikimate dehydrogenase [Muricauda myxillae]MCL6265330.1 shikimate dehydrogenase [Muricauda myxillae]
MEKIERKEKRFGLLGRNISYSFSQGYFTQKFQDLGLDDHSYENFDIPDISDFEALVAQNKLRGMNVTIPYKEQVIPFLSDMDEKAATIGAVNTIKFSKEGLKGYNTDFYGFQQSLEPLLKPHHIKALILGTGGASKAIKFVLDELGIAHCYVSRSKKEGQLTYDELDAEVIADHTVIVNCSPLGTYPNITEKPDIPYTHLTEKHLLFDLIYNPPKTAFLAAGEAQGATICNGQKMLEFQAEKAWEIWNTL